MKYQAHDCILLHEFLLQLTIARSTAACTWKFDPPEFSTASMAALRVGGRSISACGRRLPGADESLDPPLETHRCCR